MLYNNKEHYSINIIKNKYFMYILSDIEYNNEVRFDTDLNYKIDFMDKKGIDI